MPKFEYEYKSEYTIKQIYDLVLDVESYPEFLPWCSAALILEGEKPSFIADLIIHYKAFNEHYRSKVNGKINKNTAEIKVELVHGPFKHLHNSWEFKSEKNGSNIRFFIDFQFKSSLLELVLGAFFEKACKKMVSAFENRAHELYKNKA